MTAVVVRVWKLLPNPCHAIPDPNPGASDRQFPPFIDGYLKRTSMPVLRSNRAMTQVRSLPRPRHEGMSSLDQGGVGMPRRRRGRTLGVYAHRLKGSPIELTLIMRSAARLDRTRRQWRTSRISRPR